MLYFFLRFLILCLSFLSFSLTLPSFFPPLFFFAGGDEGLALDAALDAALDFFAVLFFARRTALRYLLRTLLSLALKTRTPRRIRLFDRPFLLGKSFLYKLSLRT